MHLHPKPPASLPRLKYLLFLLLLVAPLLAPAQHRPTKKVAAPTLPAGPDFLRYLHSPWVDNLMRTLTPRQRVGQLFMVAAYSNKSRVDEDSIALLVRDYGIGGAIFFQGGPVRQARMLNRLQAPSRVPLLVAMDGEWGAGMRLDSVQRFPYQMSLGAVPQADSGLIYDMGREVARQFRRLGMHVNFAPVVDVNNNPNNPVIGFRSWGENPAAVARLSRLYMRGMQDAGLLAVAKHFPGHGDVEADSHLALPLVRVDRGRLDSLEFPPFKSMIASGIGGMMVAHLNVPALDNSGGPTTLSPAVITGLLRQQLGFRGVVFTDAMNMQGVISKVPTGEAEVRALLAGNDVLEFSKNVPVALRAVLAAVDSGRISQQRIDESCRRVLALKQWAGLDHYQPVPEQQLVADLNPPHARYLSHRLTQQSLTLLRNQRNLLPLQRLDTLRVATLVLGGSPTDTTDFQQAVADYDAQAAHFHLPAAPTLDELMSLRAKLAGYNVVLVALQSLGRLPATNFGIAPEAQLLLRELAKTGQQLVLTVFGSAYAVAKVRDFDRTSAVVLAYQESPDAQRLAAQLIFGGIGAVGKLPVTVSSVLPAGFGLSTHPGLRLAYGNPEDAGMDNGLEAQVDSIMAHNQAVPGGQVLVARHGVVVLRKSYGSLAVLPPRKTFYQALAADSRQFAVIEALATKKTTNTNVYELGGLTEVLAAAPALLKLQEQGKFSPDSTLGHYFPFLRDTDKTNLVLREVLAHQARLWSSFPAGGGLAALDNKDGTPSRRWFRPDSSARFPVPVLENLWGRKDLPAYLYRQMRTEPLLDAREGQIHSNLPFYFLPWLVQQRTRQPFAEFLEKQVYQPLGSNLHFQPRHHFASNRIVPVMYDSVYHQYHYRLLQGKPFDMTTNLLGGVSGHAGLYGSANDVAQLAQTYAWGGRYGGQQLFRPDLLADYTRCQFCPASSYGLIFDRPLATQAKDPEAKGSGRSFGYDDYYTGTYCWIDPAAGLVVVVLTNHPNPVRRINTWNWTTVQTLIQRAAIQTLR
ncbi:MAG: glycoside hydrolase family 3 N-terminal domain-containing protein [Janthinobacterium lividum]